MTKTNIIAMTASVAAIAITVVAANPMSTDAKKAVKLNKSKLTLQTGKTSKLKLKNAKKKVKWSSKNKKVARVSRKGVVKAVSVGKTTIIAKSGKKKYSCKVTVVMSDADKKIKELEDKLNKVEDKVNATPTPVVTEAPTPSPVPTVTPIVTVIKKPVAVPNTPKPAPVIKPTIPPMPIPTAIPYK